MSQKIENQLNLALSITEEERQKSESLDIGYDLEEKEWELIVKSDKRTGSISRSRIYRKTEKFIFSNREWKACVLY